MNNVVGIDVSKGKSMVSVLRPFGEVVAKPFSVGHTGSELKELADYLKSLDGETRVVMEHTGRYYEPVARFLHDEGVFVSAVNPKLIKDFICMHHSINKRLKQLKYIGSSTRGEDVF